ncbi:hypothetical protein KUA23_08635 [Pseudomonas pergaminensis]|uniref:Polymerase n=1 Tax=Pseudomonas pergaminensis TaxID=2853159 RepID=A0ABD7TN06_9PSED|nr:hypothetical protein [Pseudomonas pergaminensis]USW02769.1 hypothetical protein KUA23_08635 [Pseudomonas pergaminensis]
MYFVFYFLSGFPALALNFGLGNVPVRYLALPLLAFFTQIKKVDLLLLFCSAAHLIYSFGFAEVRPFALIDLSYILGYVYIFLGVGVVRKNPRAFRIFVMVFWCLNIFYAVYQDVVLMLGGSQDWVLAHENTHDLSYTIPSVELFPFLYRVTGLFIESAPFVIYLMITHLAFSIMKVSKWLKWINLFIIFLAGAKVGYLFLLLLGGSYVLSKLGLKLLKFMMVGISLLLIFAPVLLDLIVEANSFGSLWVRLNSFYEIVLGFSSGIYGLLFGYGFVSSAQLISGDFDGPMRGIDFFSTFIYANGVLGSLILLSPLVLWVFRNARGFTLVQKNSSSLILFLALLTMGSLLNFQYAYYLFVIAFSSGCHEPERIRFKEVD